MTRSSPVRQADMEVITSLLLSAGLWTAALLTAQSGGWWRSAFVLLLIPLLVPRTLTRAVHLVLSAVMAILTWASPVLATGLGGALVLLMGHLGTGRWYELSSVLPLTRFCRQFPAWRPSRRGLTGLPQLRRLEGEWPYLLLITTGQVTRHGLEHDIRWRGLTLGELRTLAGTLSESDVPGPVPVIWLTNLQAMALSSPGDDVLIVTGAADHLHELLMADGVWRQQLAGERPPSSLAEQLAQALPAGWTSAPVDLGALVTAPDNQRCVVTRSGGPLGRHQGGLLWQAAAEHQARSVVWHPQRQAGESVTLQDAVINTVFGPLEQLTGSLINQLFDPYAVLGLTPEVNREVIKARYRALALEYHPDRVRGNLNTKRLAEARMKDINAAYQTLMN